MARMTTRLCALATTVAALLVVSVAIQAQQPPASPETSRILTGAQIVLDGAEVESPTAVAEWIQTLSRYAGS